MVNETGKENGKSVIEQKTQVLSKKVWDLESKKESKLLPTAGGKIGLEQQNQIPENTLVISDYVDPAKPNNKRFFIKRGGYVYYTDLTLTKQ